MGDVDVNVRSSMNMVSLLSVGWVWRGVVVVVVVVVVVEEVVVTEGLVCVSDKDRWACIRDAFAALKYVIMVSEEQYNSNLRGRAFLRRHSWTVPP